MQELRVVDPCDPMVAVRLKLTQGALGICDIYSDGAWWFRTTWHPFAGFDYEDIPGTLAEELACAFHKLVSKRKPYEPTTQTRSANRGRSVDHRRRPVEAVQDAGLGVRTSGG